MGVNFGHGNFNDGDHIATFGDRNFTDGNFRGLPVGVDVRGVEQVDTEAARLRNTRIELSSEPPSDV